MNRTRLIFPALFLTATALCSIPSFAANQSSDVLAGATLFRDKGCSHCHGDALEGTKKGPPLADIRTDKQWTPAKMTSQIMNGGQKMPPFSDSLTDPEIAQIVTFLRAKKHPVPPPAAPAN